MKNKSQNSKLLESKNKKLEIQKTTTEKAFGKFSYKRPRNDNNSNVGPSWGGRKGN